MSRFELVCRVNGVERRIATAPERRLIDLLREELALTGTKEACGKGECGTCTVLLDGRPVNACLTLAGQCQGRSVVTIEGLTPAAGLSALQQAFVDYGAIQCGYCTPGMVVAASALLAEIPEPSEAEIRRGLEGNLCRCTGYAKIIEAVQRVSEAGSFEGLPE